jgi:hypothetical protein
MEFLKSTKRANRNKSTQPAENKQDTKAEGFSLNKKAPQVPH